MDRMTSTRALAALTLLMGVPIGVCAQSPVATSSHPLTWITLGTQGGPAPSAERAEPANALVVAGKPWIVDCGDGAMERFATAGYTPGQARS